MSQRIFNSNTCRILFATCLSALCLIALSTQAATITVMNTNDSGAGSLRQALLDAANADTITFDSSLNGQTITLTSGELLVDKSVTINGPGSDNLTVDGNHSSRVFHVSRWVSAAIAGLMAALKGTAVAAFTTITLHWPSITAPSAAITPPGAVAFTTMAPTEARR